jgi:hypothetical protein
VRSVRAHYIAAVTADNAASELNTISTANGYHSLETYLKRFVRTQRAGKMRNDSTAHKIRDKFAL